MLLEAGILTATTLGMLQFLSTQGGLVRYYACVATYFICMLICSLWGLLICPLMLATGRRYDVNWLVARTFYEIASRLLGITMIVEGEEYLESNPAMYIGNHQSMVDILFLAKMFPKRTSMMAKESLKYTPLLGQWMLLSGAVFVDRGNSKQAMDSLDRAGKDMRERSVSLWIFPEGTRTLFETPNLLAFKKGAFHLAVKAGVPIVPVVCENYWRLYHKGVFQPGVLKIKVLPPIPTTGLTSADVTKLSTDTRELMLKTLKEISVPVSPEVEAADNAKLAKISKTSPTAQAVAAAPDVAAPAGASAPDASSGTTGAGVAPTDSGTDLSASMSDVGADAVSSSVSQSSSAEDDEMVIVDRPTSS